MVNAGCIGCHGTKGQGGVGPKWVGLYGSQVRLDDGTTVTADADYLTRAIKDPASQLVAGYNVNMPVNHLTDAEVAVLVAYIQSLATSTATSVSTLSPVPSLAPVPTAAPAGSG